MRANLPRWRGQAGFFEIWFLVVVPPGGGRAWWLRYTTFAPRAGAPRATLWAAAFDLAAAEPAMALKRVAPLDAWDAGPRDRFAIRVGDAELGEGVCRGRVEDRAHAIAWDLRFVPAPRTSPRGPQWLAPLPLPTRVAHVHGEVPVDGWVAVDGVRHEVRGARAVQKHIWGTRRVEELYWLWCPWLVEDDAAALEVTAVRLRRRRGTPRLTPLWLRTCEGEVHAWGAASLFSARVETPAVGELRVRSASPMRSITAHAWCDPRTLAGWVYRDPSGFDLHVAQSDVASCEVELRTRAHPFAAWGPARRLTARHAAALEFHHPEPLPGVRYVAWDG